MRVVREVRRGYVWSLLRLARLVPMQVGMLIIVIFGVIPSVYSQSQPVAQNPEPSFGSGKGDPNGCLVGGVLYAFGEFCDERTTIDACNYSRPRCVKQNDVGVCQTQTFYEANTVECKAGGPCDPPDKCDGKGNCVVVAPFSLPQNTDCISYECSSDYRDTTWVSITKPATNAECQRVADTPGSCGTSYWVQYVTLKAAKCGGTACPAKMQVASPCGTPGATLYVCSGGSYTRVYGDANPAFAYTCTPGYVSGGKFASGPATTANVGQYTIDFATKPSGSGITVSTLPANLTITKRAVTCTVDSKTKVFGEPNPPLTFSCNSLVSPDTVSSIFGTTTPVTTANTQSPVGTYPITLQAPSAQNYDITVVSGQLTVTKRTPTCQWSPSPLSDISYGAPISSLFTASAIGVNGALTSGYVIYNPDKNTTLSASATPYTLKYTWSPTDGTPDAVNYNSVTCTNTVKVNKAPTSCTLSPSPMTTVDNVSFANLNAAGSKPGTFTYTYSSTNTAVVEGVKLAAGSYAISAQFTPSDSTNYLPATCTGTLQVTGCVSNLDPTMTLECPNTIKIEFNDILECLNPSDPGTYYRIGVDTVGAPLWPSNKGNLVSMEDSFVKRKDCSAGKCIFIRSISGFNFRAGLTLYGGVAAFNSGSFLRQAGASKPGNCPSSGCVPRSCIGEKTVFDTALCDCRCENIDPQSCGSNCRQGSYPNCVVCSLTCPAKFVTYYSPDGQCMIASAWGPSEACCPRAGCYIGVHGYGDKYDGTLQEWYKLIDVVSACPTQKGVIIGDPIRCPTCKCTGTLDCSKVNPDAPGERYREIAGGMIPKYGHEVYRDGNGVRTGQGFDGCWCVPNPAACPVGYTSMQTFNLEIEYTPILTAKSSELSDTQCKLSDVPNMDGPGGN